MGKKVAWFQLEVLKHTFISMFEHSLECSNGVNKTLPTEGFRYSLVPFQPFLISGHFIDISLVPQNSDQHYLFSQRFGVYPSHGTSIGSPPLVLCFGPIFIPQSNFFGQPTSASHCAEWQPFHKRQSCKGKEQLC